MTDLLGMLQKAVEAGGEEVSFPAEEAVIAIIAAIRAVNASYEKETAKTGYKNLLDLHQETYKDLQDARAEARELRAELSAWRELHTAATVGTPDLWPNDWPQDVSAVAFVIRQQRDELEEANKLRSLLHTFAVNVNSLGALDAASQLILDMKAFAARSQPAEPAQREGE